MCNVMSLIVPLPYLVANTRIIEWYRPTQRGTNDYMLVDPFSEAQVYPCCKDSPCRYMDNSHHMVQNWTMSIRGYTLSNLTSIT